jgi:Ceramidase
MLGVAFGIGVLAYRLPPVPQSPSYHQFADQRAWLGIANFGNVVSNLAFAIVGFWGLWLLLKPEKLDNAFLDQRERRPYAVAFFGLLLTAFGSAYYHLAPSNSRLVWDRLPMTIVFASLVAVVIMECISVEAGLKLLSFLAAIAAGSVLQWYHDELSGHGDLRFYAAVQLYSALVLLIALLLKRRYSRSWDFAVVFGFYLLAKIFETADRFILVHAHILSGHTLKHLAAAAAGYRILQMLQLRDPVAKNSSQINTPCLSST